MDEKQQQLLFDKGITNVPSDLLCSDNALEESVGMIYDNGEHRVIQNPVAFVTSASSGSIPWLITVHRVDGQDNYIAYGKTTPTMVWGTVSEGTFTQGGSFSITHTVHTKVATIGKTLIISDGNGLHYFLWKGSSYEGIGPIPDPQVEFQLREFAANADENGNTKEVENLEVKIGSDWRGAAYYKYNERADIVKHTESHEGIFKTTYDMEQGAKDPDNESEPWPEKKQTDYNNLVIGCYAANKKSVAANKCFCNPFFVRVALEMYDGSYTHIGPPILMMTSTGHNTWARLSDGYSLTLYTVTRQLMFKQNTDYSKWSDIIKDVVLFVSDDIDVNETTMDVNVFTSHGTFSCSGIYAINENGNWYTYRRTFNQTNFVSPIERATGADTSKLQYHFNPFKLRTDDDMTQSISSVSVFYKLCKIGATPTTAWTSTRNMIEKGVLENITTQESLETDDYFSRCSLTADSIFAYNSRLNLANVKRGFFEGFDFFMAYDALSQSTCTYYVTIKTDAGERIVKHTVPASYTLGGYYFYYPDPRATNVSFTSSPSRNYKLKEHPGLNGAYWFAGMSAVKAGTLPSSDGASKTTVDTTPELLPNYILTSEVNNPFVFKAEGYNAVGTGDVIGISSTTQALSEGQFGQYPILAFTTEGIWAMSVNGTGLYSAIHPMSREVCSNANSITQTDGAVFFASAKGLMVVAGSQVKCVSEQLSGKKNTFNPSGSSELTADLGVFSEYLKTAKIAYDYRDSMLWIFNSQKRHCYVYSIKCGTFGKYELAWTVPNVANSYPDYLIQNTAGTVYSLLNRTDINSDTATYTGLMITRPMKLENGLALKTLMSIRNLKQFTNETVTTGGTTVSTLQLTVYGSNNLTSWVTLTSLRGTPWKYYRFKFDLAGMKATDRFAGSVVVTQERRTDKQR